MVIGVAITRILPPGYFSTAGLSAGSVPITGILGYCSRSMPMAADVAVLQAMTSAFAPSSISLLIAVSTSARISCSDLTP